MYTQSNYPKDQQAKATKLTLKQFVSKAQVRALLEGLNGEEANFFIDKINEMENRINAMPKTYETEGQGVQAVAYLHYFLGGADFYITERDCEAEQLQAFGLANMGYGGEMGYISIQELIANGAELDLHFEPQALAKVLKRMA